MKNFQEALIVLLFCLSCSEAHHDTKLVGQEDLLAPIQQEILNEDPLEQFTTERIEALGDSLVSYFNEKAGYKITWHKTEIDTLFIENYEKTRISLKTQTYKTHGMINYDLYRFETADEATDFFNDLKTKELISPYRLNKSPDHILLDSNRVFWHQLTHGYGHRVKDLSKIFNSTFQFKPQAANLDSVSGQDYCHCLREDADLSTVFGSWESNLILEDIYLYNPEHTSFLATNLVSCFEKHPEKLTLIINPDSIRLNDQALKSTVYSSIEFPNNNLYWKNTEIDRFEIQHYGAHYSDEFKIRREQIAKSKEPIIVYDINFSNHCYATFVRLRNDRMVMLVDNSCIELGRIP